MQRNAPTRTTKVDCANGVNTGCVITFKKEIQNSRKQHKNERFINRVVLPYG